MMRELSVSRDIRQELKSGIVRQARNYTFSPIRNEQPGSQLHERFTVISINMNNISSHARMSSKVNDRMHDWVNGGMNGGMNGGGEWWGDRWGEWWDEWGGEGRGGVW